MPAVSVIVPAYNAEKSLPRCIDSILAQTYLDFELIIIDDGSADGTSRICDDYAEKDVRVKVIHKRNAGVGAARNSGLEVAKGEFVAFVDSDDAVLTEYLSHLIAAFRPDIDITVSNEIVIRGGTALTRKYSPIVSDNEDFDKVFARNYIYTSPWAKMYRRSVISENDLKFPEDFSIGEDAVFLLSYITESKGIAVTEYSDYEYYNDVVADGLTQKRYPVEKELYISAKIDEVVDRLIEKKNVHSAAALHNLNIVKSLYVERVLESLYFSGKEMGCSQRLEIIKRLDLSVIRVFPFRCGFRSWLLSHLLKWRLIRVYDAARMVAKNVRRG